MTVEEVQTDVQEAIDDLIASDAETGLQVAVIKNGSTVVDAVGGLADSVTGEEVSRATLFWAGSTAKGVASTLAHVLVERGVLDYETRLAELWPEFAAHGKDAITLRHVLTHTAGVPGLPGNTTVEDLCDWEHMCATIAAAKPWWKPGERFGYHAKTFGFLVGETLRRATGQSVSALLRELITGPLGVEDYVHFAVPRRLLPRVARQTQPDGSPPAQSPEAGSPLSKAMPPAVTPDAEYANRPEVLAANIPSEGTMSAHGVARMYAALLGHVDGARLVSPERLATMASVTFKGMDEVMGFPTEWAFGYAPTRPGGVPSRAGSAFGMIGMNGSAAYADIDSGLAVAVMRNRFTVGDSTAAARIDHIAAGCMLDQ